MVLGNILYCFLSTEGEICIRMVNLHCWPTDSVLMGQSFSMNVPKTNVQFKHPALPAFFYPTEQK